MADQYDVFLSHNSADKTFVRGIADWLGKNGVSCFLDEQVLLPGDVLTDALGKGMDASRSAIICIGPNGEGPWHRKEMDTLLNRSIKQLRQNNEFRLIPVLLPDADLSKMHWFLEGEVWCDLSKGITENEAQMQRLKRAILGERGAVPVPIDPKLRPYPGLEAFDRDNAHFFHGRTEEIADLADKLQKWHFACIEGPSGNGKSSLARAGLDTETAQALLPGVDQWERLTVKPGRDLLSSLLNQLYANLPNEARASAVSAALTRIMADTGPKALTPAAWAAGLDRELHCFYADPATSVLILIDQFEEIFTHRSFAESTDEEHETQLKLVMEGLSQLIQQGNKRWYFVLTLRSDFRRRCEIAPGFWDLLTKKHLLLPLAELDEDGWRAAIKEPATRAGAYLEAGLVETMLKDIRHQKGTTPLLQLTLQELWKSREDACLTHQSYKKCGGVANALQRRAENALGQFRDGDSQSLKIARNLFLRLTSLGEGVSDTRRRMDQSEREWVESRGRRIDWKKIDYVIDELSGPENRLIVSDQAAIEVTHEVLIRECNTVSSWIEASRRDIAILRMLTRAARQWLESGRDPICLDGAGPPRQLKFWIRRMREKEKEKEIWITELEQEYWDASRAEQVRRHKEKRKQARDLQTAQREALRRAEELAEQKQQALEQAEIYGEAQRAALLEAEAVAKERQTNLEVQLLAKRRLARLTAIAVTLAVVAGYFMYSAERSASSARQNEMIARQNAEAAERNAENAILERTSAERAINEVFLKMRDSLRREGRLHLIAPSFDPADIYFKSSEPPGFTHAEQYGLFLFTSAEMLMEIGDTGRAMKMLTACRDLREKLCDVDNPPAHWRADLARTYDKLSEVHVRDREGSRAKAREFFESAKRLRAAVLAHRAPGIPEDDWQYWQREAARQWEREGDFYIADKKSDDALSCYQQGAAMLTTMLNTAPNNVEVIWMLCQNESRQAQLAMDYPKPGMDAKAILDKATNLMARCVELDPREIYVRDLASLLERQGEFARRLRKLDEAEAFYRKALARRQEALDRNESSTECMRFKALTQQHLASVLMASNKPRTEIHELLAESEQSLEVVYKQRPGETAIASETADCYERSGDLLLWDENPTAALGKFERSRELRGILHTSDPDHPRAKRDLSASFERIGDCYKQLKRFAEALQSYEASEKLRGELPPDTESRWLIAISKIRQSDLKLKQGDPADAKLSNIDARYLLTKLCIEQPERVDWQMNLADAHCQGAECDNASGNHTEAVNSYTSALSILEAIIAKSGGSTPKTWELQAAIGKAKCGRGMSYYDDDALAATDLGEGIAALQSLSKDNPMPAYIKELLENARRALDAILSR